MLYKKRVALISGGYSGESSISLRSCAYLMNELDNSVFQFIKVVLKSPSLWYVEEEGRKYLLAKEDFSYKKEGVKQQFDLAFIYIHGTPGEDGKLQNYFDLIGLSYLGSSAVSSAITFNKHISKMIAIQVGLSSAKSILVKANTIVTEKDIKGFKTPIIIKPNEGGSSIGISLAETKKAVLNLFNKTMERDMILEEYIEGREFSIGVYQQRNKKVRVLPITEVIPYDTFFDYEAKYESKSDEITPASIEEYLQKQLEYNAQLVYKEFDCKGVVRIDFIYSKKEEAIYFLEVNTIPGLSTQSILPQQLQAAQLDFKKFYIDLLTSYIDDQ